MKECAENSSTDAMTVLIRAYSETAYRGSVPDGLQKFTANLSLEKGFDLRDVCLLNQLFTNLLNYSEKVDFPLSVGREVYINRENLITSAEDFISVCARSDAPGTGPEMLAGLKVVLSRETPDTENLNAIAQLADATSTNMDLFIQAPEQ